MHKVEVSIPDGDTCMYQTGKPCVMARYTKKWDGYNCRLYNRMLKGEQTPRKCKACLKYCGEATAEEVQNGTEHED